MSLYSEKVIKYGPRFMKDLGLTSAQVSGIFGNFYVETGGFKLLQELNPVVSGSRGGWGWAQWTGPRRRSFEAWVDMKGLNRSSDEANYQFTVYEFKGSEGVALHKLRKATTPKDAAIAVCKYYERPGVPHLDRRIKAAEEAYRYLKVSPTPVSTPVETTVPEKLPKSLFGMIIEFIASLFKRKQ